MSARTIAVLCAVGPMQVGRKRIESGERSQCERHEMSVYSMSLQIVSTSSQETAPPRLIRQGLTESSRDLEQRRFPVSCFTLCRLAAYLSSTRTDTSFPFLTQRSRHARMGAQPPFALSLSKGSGASCEVRRSLRWAQREWETPFPFVRRRCENKRRRSPRSHRAPRTHPVPVARLLKIVSTGSTRTDYLFPFVWDSEEKHEWGRSHPFALSLSKGSSSDVAVIPQFVATGSQETAPLRLIRQGLTESSRDLKQRRSPVYCFTLCRRAAYLSSARTDTSFPFVTQRSRHARMGAQPPFALSLSKGSLHPVSLAEAPR
jgi:hypothetical protein